ncbi:hypothetical protein [Dyella silvatica]|uniref:hypothetical protein n=1 Tax=Dyella silvatica TaxID=2992128 RepID=UPI00225478B3|nr:hypothetical protein [Dyella silvatica]
MKFESLMLRSLFVACMLICGLTLVAMLNAAPDAAASQGQLLSAASNASAGA